jgi:hypothetical protein
MVGARLDEMFVAKLQVNHWLSGTGMEQPECNLVDALSA